MTLRQAMAIILSCIKYGHPITASGVLGVLIVFSAVFLKIYYGYRLRKLKAQSKKESSQTMETHTLTISIESNQQKI
jgi:adenosine 3'-phospho 5'-phosphosulfate transporter B2